eukprot:8083191-Ditylum_brightwellii.AAC.1
MEKGKWFFLYAKAKYQEVNNFIDNDLPTIFDQIVISSKLEEYPVPRRFTRAKSNLVGTYAEVLKGLTKESNPQEDESKEFNEAPLNRKRK